MIETFDLAVATAYARWKRAVDLLVREVVRRRENRLAEEERLRAERRMKSLRRIVRKALSDYSRLQIRRRERLLGISLTRPAPGSPEPATEGRPSRSRQRRPRAGGKGPRPSA